MEKGTRDNIKKIRFGIEIEVEFPEAKDSYNLIEKHRIIPGWTIGYDGSLDNGAEYKPTDKNKLYFTEDSIDQIKEIIGLIKAHRGNIRPTCGLHIHIDMSKFKNKEIINIIKSFIRTQNYIYKDFNIVKSRIRETASKIPRKILKKLNTKIINKLLKKETVNHSEDYFMNRYYGLNLTSLSDHNTLEFRLFNGTIQVRRIRKYIKWCLKFCLENKK